MHLTATQAKIGQYIVVPVLLLGAVVCAIQEFAVGTIIFFILFVCMQSLLWWHKDRNPIQIRATNFTNIGFIACYNRVKLPLRWRDIHTITASKRGKGDVIRVDIFTLNNEYPFNSTCDGWKALLKHIEKQFPNSPKNWSVNMPFSLELQSAVFRVLYDHQNRETTEIMNIHYMK